MTAQPEPPTEEVAALMAEAGLDMEKSGLQYLSNEARVRICSVVVCALLRLRGHSRLRALAHARWTQWRLCAPVHLSTYRSPNLL